MQILEEEFVFNIWKKLRKVQEGNNLQRRKTLGTNGAE